MENYAAILRCDGTIDTRLEEVSEFYENDIVIFQSNVREIIGLPGVSLREIFEKHQIPPQWSMDEYGHCNHKALELIAEDLLEMIAPCLSKKVVQGSSGQIEIDFHAVMKTYVQHKYLDRYFSNFDGWQYDTVGAIVMNGNPFDEGHRYLIEQAGQQVDFLIIFVLQEDEFLFPFEERYKMVKEGTKDLENVMVVPNGDFVFAKDTFREYYVTREMEAASANARYDIHLFVDYIAPPLHITHRFTGKESKNKIIKTYNEAMESILPQKGITCVEVPKKKMEEGNVSAVKIHKYLRDADYTKAAALLPDATKNYLMQQLDLSAEELIG